MTWNITWAQSQSLIKIPDGINKYNTVHVLYPTNDASRMSTTPNEESRFELIILLKGL